MKKTLIIILGIMLMVLPMYSCGSKDDADTGSGGQGAEITDTDGEESDEGEVVEDDWDPTDINIPEEGTNFRGETLEERLPYLKNDGWKAKGTAYVFTTEDEGCTGEYSVKASDYDAEVTVSFDYGKNNKEMLAFYKENKESAAAVCSYWYLRATDVTGITEGSVSYTLKIDGKKAADGELTYEQAIEAYDGYYSD